MAVYKRTYQGADGKPSIVYWIDFYFQGKRYRRHAGTDHKEAKKALDRILGRIASGDFEPAELEPAQGVLFESALKLFAEHWRAQGKLDSSYLYLLAPKSNDSTRPSWPAVFTGRPLASIKSEDIETILTRWAEDNDWSPGTRNGALMQLSALFSYAYGRRWIDAHPIEKGRVPLLPVDNARTRWLRLDEIEKLKVTARTLGARSASSGIPQVQRKAVWLRDAFPVVVDFACMTGMRLGEVCGLRRAHYQKDARGRAFIVTEKTKNGERLYWPVEGPALALVEAAAKRARFPGAYLFPGPRGGNAESCIKRELPGVVRAAGMKYGRKKGGKAIADGVTFHVFRHSMASLALNAGIPEPVVQRMGNWKTRTMVARYAHLADETLRDAAGKLAAIVSATARHTVGHAVDTRGDSSATA